MQIYVRTVILISLLVFWTLPSMAQRISPEMAVSPPEWGPADHLQQMPSVAGNGDVFLVAWMNSYPLNGEVYAARIARDGRLLDPLPIPIAAGTRPGGAPRVAWSGRWFFVLWLSNSRHILTALNTDGAIVAEQEVDWDYVTSFTCSTTRCLVVTATPNDLAGQSRLRATFLDSEGNVVSRDNPIATVRGNVTVRAATNGEDFLVSWSQFDPQAIKRHTLYAVLVRADGTSNEPREITSLSPAHHSVSSNGSEFLLLASSGSSNAVTIHTLRLSPAGVPADDPQVFASGSALGYRVGAMPVNEGYLVVTEMVKPEKLIKRHVAADGKPLSPSGTVSDRYSMRNGFEVAAAGGIPVVVWLQDDFSPTFANLYGTVLDGSPAEPVLISRSARAQRNPDVVMVGDDALAVWSEAVDSWWQVRAARNAMVFAVAPVEGHQENPKIAFNGRNHLVVWNERDEYKVMARMISENGIPMGATMLMTGTACFHSPAVTAGNRDFLITWSDCGSAAPQILGLLLRSDGTDQRIRIATGASGGFMVPGGIAWSGQDYLVTWLDGQPGPGCDVVPCGSPMVRAARVSASGALLDSAPLQISPDRTDLVPPDVIWDGSQYFVGWINRADVSGAVVSGQGTVSAARVFAERQGQHRESLSLGWDGSYVLAVWGEILGWDSLRFPGRDIWGCRITPFQFASGTVAPVFPLAESIDSESAPTVAVAGVARLAIAYQRAAHERDYASANRVFLRFLNNVERKRPIRR
jgi:hypothetical protein